MKKNEKSLVAQSGEPGRGIAEGHKIVSGKGKKPPKVAGFEKALV